MKYVFLKMISVVFFVISYSGSFAQTLPNFDLIKLEKAPDYKAATPFVLQTANYLMSIPYTKDNPDRLKSLQFLSKWMTGIPDYSFAVNDVASKITKGNYDILGIYMAAMVKYTLENKDAAKDAKNVKLNTMGLLIDYCADKKNNIPMTKSLKKLADAKAKGQLQEAMDAL